ncbi:glycosyltransferase WbsX family protein [Sulfurimicrobium lacus]|uniref:glycosyltransferase WbsX family protein n=1 Tax=Sulfurimicrobium lacus TaxID=2715678 RepID=UPI001564889E|nr:glycoside hydrolase family 99-like domain-containing protein [Sulfurimicrobium lacus]
MNDSTTPENADGQTDTGSHSIRPRLIAFYLTQFHPIPENDAWWGKGFTEWINVTKAKPLFEGHDQPHLPTDFGFYDLRVRATRHDQIRLAKQFGIDGFCYHYYWFSGTRLLNQPLDDMLSDSESDMPFCLCWANENWTRRWDAAEHEILIAQRYQPDDDLNFIKSLIPFFSDSRYIRISGIPFLIIYRPQHLPDARKTAAIWRAYCRSIGIGEIHLCAALTHGNEDYSQFGFDSGVEFPPHNIQCRNVADQIMFHEPFRGYVAQYQEIARAYLERKYRHDNVFKGVFPSWDNTARTGNRGVIVRDSTPGNYEYWLAQTLRETMNRFPGQERFVFINAWNEWAEGCHLEPDRKYQRQFLEATLRAKNGMTQLQGFSKAALPSVGDGQKRTLFRDLRWVVSYHFAVFVGRLVGLLKRFPRIRRFVRWVFNGVR